MSKTLSFSLAALLSISLVALPGCSSDKPEPKKTTKKTPKPKKPAPQQTAQNSKQVELWNTFSTAMANRQWGDAYKCLTTESQKLLLGTMIIGGQRLADQNPTLADSFNALVAECGVTPTSLALPKPALEMEARELDPLARTIAEPIADKPACFAKVVDWITANTPANQTFRFVDPVHYQNTKLTTVTVSRDKAYANVVTTIPGEEGDPPTEYRHGIVFSLVAGTWLIDLEASDPTEPNKSQSGTPSV